MSSVLCADVFSSTGRPHTSTSAGRKGQQARAAWFYANCSSANHYFKTRPKREILHVKLDEKHVATFDFSQNRRHKQTEISLRCVLNSSNDQTLQKATQYFLSNSCLALDIACKDKTTSITPSPKARKLTSLKEFCEYSPEAKRIGLDAFLKKVQLSYYEHFPNQVSYQPDIKSEEMSEHVLKRYFPYDPRPEVLKKKTDAALGLLREIQSAKYDERKLKPRENRVIAQAKHFLQQNFGTPYDQNFYAADWMMGPNYFCWQPICYLGYDVNALGYNSKPKTIQDIEQMLLKITTHNMTVDNYIENMKLGVKAGMVRTKIDCKAGLDAFLEYYKAIAKNRQANAVLQEWFGVSVVSYITNHVTALNNTLDQTWKAKSGRTIKESVQKALVDGVGKPIVKLINYLELNHSIHCLENDMSSGLGNLPVANVYTNGIPGEKTTQKMPITNAPLSGKASYKLILPYFTTSAITPEEINKEGERQLKLFYSETLKISRKIIKEANTTEEAVTKFKAMLQGDNMWHGETKFPVNESNAYAHKKCIDDESAKKHCPYCQRIMSLIYPKISPLFHFNGEKNTVPNCPIQMWPHYNPSNGAQFFGKSDSKCSSFTKFGLPFFLEKYGPKYQEWSVIGHEARPGHHTQYQGIEEHFRDKCGGLPSWFDKRTSYTVFVEGWALYGENPLLSDDVNLYKENLLQKYGMFKWQTWRAVRLIVDTGLHYRGKNMTWARKMFEDYTWDTGDFARKEIVRYMSDPGQAVAYMLGRLELIKLRNKATAELGKKFDLKDFHYQVLSQGSSPIDYLKSHVMRYIECKNSPTLPMCEYILTPVKTLKNDLKTTSTATTDTGPQRPTHRHFV
eukprot:gene4766-5393_t